MKIDVTNAAIINSKEVYVHDDKMYGLGFDLEGKILEITAIDWNDLPKYREEDYYDWNTNTFNYPELNMEALPKYKIVFHNVLGIEMTLCDFWSGSIEDIIDFEYIEPQNRTLIEKLFEKKEYEPINAFMGKEKNSFFETVMTFNSGDTLRVVCEHIIYPKVS